jgi:hypothetical protein
MSTKEYNFGTLTDDGLFHISDNILKESSIARPDLIIIVKKGENGRSCLHEIYKITKEILATFKLSEFLKNYKYYLPMYFEHS